MSDESELLAKRFVELAKKSYNHGIYTFTDFLGLAEQSVFGSVQREILGIKHSLFGGTEGCERIMIRFGSEEELGYELPFPIALIKAEPKSARFADKLTHRDFLGAVLNLGIERRLVGDIVIRDNVGYIFVKEDIADFIISELTRAKHTELSLSLVDTVPEGELYKTELRRVQANGERLDALIAKLFSLSREEAQVLFTKRLVFASGRLIESTSYIPKPGEVISVRGKGRFIYRGVEGLSRKGKLNIILEAYT